MNEQNDSQPVELSKEEMEDVWGGSRLFSYHLELIAENLDIQPVDRT